MSNILKCPLCEDRDCSLNIEGKCNSISTIMEKIPSGIYTCNGAVIEFKREPKEGELW